TRPSCAADGWSGASPAARNGHTLGRACGIALLRGDAPVEGAFTVDCAGVSFEADVSPVPFYDPASARLRG
ncbi:MAG: hypothetical protein M3O86_01370, partial [Actinomycetota bacterium]|nr:hypothetical protein [Actinomycetota bacterium]